MPILMPVAALIGGFVLLVWAADRFVIGAGATARNLGVSPLIIGLTVVGFATSAPEMFTAAIAAGQGNPGLAIGNAIGSNIANIGLVIGLTAVISPLVIHSRILKREYPLLFVITGLAMLLMIDGELGVADGVVLVIACGALIYWMVRLGKRERDSDALAEELDAEIPRAMPMRKALFLLVLGLVVLIAGSKILVWGAVDLARIMGVSDLVIGLTIVAVGTSLPELAAAIASVLKKEDDLAIGNVIGSNMFNTLAVLPLPGLIAPGGFSPMILSRDLPVMIIMTILLYLISKGIMSSNKIGCGKGTVLLAGFIGYQIWVYMTAAH